MSDSEQVMSKRDQIELIIVRETVGIAVGLLVLLLLHPSTRARARLLVRRALAFGRPAKLSAEIAVAELNRDISRYEHGEVSL